MNKDEKDRLERYARDYSAGDLASMLVEAEAALDAARVVLQAAKKVVAYDDHLDHGHLPGRINGRAYTRVWGDDFDRLCVMIGVEHPQQRRRR